MNASDPEIPEQPTGEPAPEAGTRKLAAIMFTDIKDFSAKMQKDEQATMRMLNVHNTMMRQTVHKYSGIVVKTVGDAFLVMFNSVVSATQCAIEVQQRFYEYNLQFKADEDKILVRIGIHLGDVIETDRDIFGDGVNIASRVQSTAEVGGVNVSESVYQQVRSKLNISVIDLGVPQLKGINERIRIYQIIIIPTDKARGKIATNLYVARTILKRKKTKKAIGIGAGVIVVIAIGWYYFFGPAPPANSLAVLPFTNVGDPANEYIADGFTDDITSRISGLAGVTVLSEGSTREFKNSNLSEKDIAKKLNVRFLIVGSVEVAKNDITVRMRMVDPNEGTGGRDWINQTLTKSRSEVFSIQHDLFTQVRLQFNEKIAEEEKSQRVPSEVWDLYWHGLEEDHKETKGSNALAISLFEQATAKDSTFVLAYIKLASVELLNHEYQYDPSEKWIIEAEKNARRAYALDSTNAQVYWVLGRLYLTKGDHKQGIAYLEKSIQLNKNWMRSYEALGDEYLFNLNEPEKAIAEYTKANELEPANYGTLLNLGNAYAIMKNYPDAISAFDRAAEQNTTKDFPLQNLGYLYMLTGSNDTAEVVLKEAAQRNPANPVVARLYSMLMIQRNRFAQAESSLTACLRYDPKNYLLLDMLGTAKLRHAQRDSALSIWKNAQAVSKSTAEANPNVSLHFLYTGIFYARLGDADSAIRYGSLAWSKDSSSDNAIGLAKIYAFLGDKDRMIQWFAKAKSMDPEYDTSFLSVEIDFDKYKSDQDFVALAKK